MSLRQLVGMVVSQRCWSAPGPSMSAKVAALCGAITMEGEIFQPCPRSRAALAPVPSVAIPALPFSPVKFSALIERVLACDSREMLCSPIPRPLKDVIWATLLLPSIGYVCLIVLAADPGYLSFY